MARSRVQNPERDFNAKPRGDECGKQKKDVMITDTSDERRKSLDEYLSKLEILDEIDALGPEDRPNIFEALSDPKLFQSLAKLVKDRRRVH